MCFLWLNTYKKPFGFFFSFCILIVLYMDICQIKFLNVLLWFGFSFYDIFFWWCLAYFSFVAYPSGGHSKNSVNSVLTTQTHSFSFSYDFEFLFLSSEKYWLALFFCVWTGSCLPLLPNTFLSLNDLGILRPGDYKWKGLFLGFQFYSPNNRNCWLVFQAGSYAWAHLLLNYAVILTLFLVPTCRGSSLDHGW